MTTSRDLELIGDECLFWASDFPHEGIVDMSKAVNEFLSREDIPEAAKRKISYDNPKTALRQFRNSRFNCSNRSSRSNCLAESGSGHWNDWNV